ncbi:hypothetical protein RJ641_013293 [Dillenia turbinata]|uniref:Uncharacterized protein n=1 Tax=Dillenia turbinata TaxID=194707 RepID=A0AAN8ZLA3_9MAGN
MESMKPHVVCIPTPFQGHINPMLKLAQLLHHKGFHITFVHSEFILQRLIDSKALDSVSAFDSFQFATISDGLPPTSTRSMLDFPALAISLPIHGLKSFRDLILRLNNSPNNPPVSFIISDATMGFTLKVAEEFGIPELLFYTHGACGVLGYLQFEELVKRGYFPLKVDRRPSPIRVQKGKGRRYPTSKAHRGNHSRKENRSLRVLLVLTATTRPLHVPHLASIYVSLRLYDRQPNKNLTFPKQPLSMDLHHRNGSQMFQ